MVFNSSVDDANSPKMVKEGLWAFPPDKQFNSSRSWWLGSTPQPVLVDCPVVNESNIETLKKLSLGRTSLIVLTNRENHGRVSELQEVLGWPVLVQEQEAFLLPGIQQLESFSQEHVTLSGLCLLWTPGPSPGSCVVYAPHPWNVLFCGRLLIPLRKNHLGALRTRKTFHWTRYQNSLKKLRHWLPPEPLPELASGASLQSHGGGALYHWDAWKELKKARI